MAAPTTAAHVKKILANPEPSTHGPSRRFHRGPASLPGPVAIDTRNHRTASSKMACTGPGSAQLFLISRPAALILIAAPFSSRLSRYSRHRQLLSRPSVAPLYGEHWPLAANSPQHGRSYSSRGRSRLFVKPDPGWSPTTPVLTSSSSRTALDSRPSFEGST